MLCKKSCLFKRFFPTNLNKILIIIICEEKKHAFADLPKFYVRKKAWVRKSQIYKLQICIWQIKIGSANRKSAKCHICGRSTNLTNYLSPPSRGFAICGTYLRTAHLWHSPSAYLYRLPCNPALKCFLSWLGRKVNKDFSALSPLCQLAVGRGDKEERVNSINDRYSGIHCGRVKELSKHGGKGIISSSNIWEEICKHSRFLIWSVRPFLPKYSETTLDLFSITS